MKKYLFAFFIILSGMNFASAAGDLKSAIDVCNIVVQLGGIFRTIRNLAFIGAAFVIAGWAWGFIQSGKADTKEIRDKGFGLIVGFTLLFSIGIIMTLLNSGCSDEFSKSW